MRHLLKIALYILLPLFVLTVVGTIAARCADALTVAQQNLAGDIMLQEFVGILFAVSALHAHTFLDD